MSASPLKPHVLLLEPLHAEALDRLESQARVTALPSPDVAPGELDSVDAIITRGRGRVTDALLARAPSLRVVARAGVGVDNIDLVAAARRGVTVLNVPDALTDTVAEHALALALAARRSILPAATDARAGRWERRNEYRGETLAGARTTVVGLGSIGSRAAALFRAVGADVTTWSRSPRHDPRFEPDLARALTGAEVVTLHVALCPASRGFFGQELIEHLAPRAVLVNTARPAVTNRDAVLAALDTGALSAYAVDGFDPEPPDPTDALLTHPRAIVTPHVAALTDRTYRELCRATVAGVVDFLAGRALEGQAQPVARPSS